MPLWHPCCSDSKCALVVAREGGPAATPAAPALAAAASVCGAWRLAPEAPEGQAETACRPLARTPSLAMCPARPHCLQTMHVTRLATLIFALTSMASSLGLGFLLTMKLGRRLGLHLMYCIAALPGVVLLQVWPAGRQAGAAWAGTLLCAQLWRRKRCAVDCVASVVPTGTRHPLNMLHAPSMPACSVVFAGHSALVWRPYRPVHQRDSGGSYVHQARQYGCVAFLRAMYAEQQEAVPCACCSKPSRSSCTANTAPCTAITSTRCI